jgi:hypothetical protein
MLTPVLAFADYYLELFALYPLSDQIVRITPPLICVI